MLLHGYSYLNLNKRLQIVKSTTILVVLALGQYKETFRKGYFDNGWEWKDAVCNIGVWRVG